MVSLIEFSASRISSMTDSSSGSMYCIVPDCFRMSSEADVEVNTFFSSNSVRNFPSISGGNVS